MEHSQSQDILVDGCDLSNYRNLFRDAFEDGRTNSSCTHLYWSIHFEVSWLFWQPRCWHPIDSARRWERGTWKYVWLEHLSRNSDKDITFQAPTRLNRLRFSRGERCSVNKIFTPLARRIPPPLGCCVVFPRRLILSPVSVCKHLIPDAVSAHAQDQLQRQVTPDSFSHLDDCYSQDSRRDFHAAFLWRPEEFIVATNVWNQCYVICDNNTLSKNRFVEMQCNWKCWTKL